MSTLATIACGFDEGAVGRRYIPIRFERLGPSDGRHFRVTDLHGGRRIEQLIPARYARPFYQARPGEHLKAEIFERVDGQLRMRRIKGSRRREIRMERVMFRFAEIIAVGTGILATMPIKVTH